MSHALMSKWTIRDCLPVRLRKTHGVRDRYSSLIGCSRPTTAERRPASFNAAIPNNTSIFKRPTPIPTRLHLLSHNSNEHPQRPSVAKRTVRTAYWRARRSAADHGENSVGRCCWMSTWTAARRSTPITLLVIKRFCHGRFIVVAPFHGDQRYGPIKINDLGTAPVTSSATILEVAELMAVCAISVSATLDYVLNHPSYRDRIDPSAVGGQGASLWRAGAHA